MTIIWNLSSPSWNTKYKKVSNALNIRLFYLNYKNLKLLYKFNFK